MSRSSVITRVLASGPLLSGLRTRADEAARRRLARLLRQHIAEAQKVDAVRESGHV